MRASLAALFSTLALTASGCTIQYVNPAPDQPPGPTAYQDAPPDAPVISDPSVVVVDEEPPPPDRVYIYDPGYPPGCYYYNGFYYYGGYRYPHDVFINRYVNVNVREHRYVDVEQNRRMGAPIVERQRQDYARNGGHRGNNHEDVPAHPNGGGPPHDDHNHY